MSPSWNRKQELTFTDVWYLLDSSLGILARDVGFFRRNIYKVTMAGFRCLVKLLLDSTERRNVGAPPGAGLGLQPRRGSREVSPK